MPTYVFECNNCGEMEEKIMDTFDHESRPVCPECGEKMEKVITSPAGLIFNGDGFYENDYGGEE